MQVQSPISNLRDVLVKIKETANTYKSQFVNNEAATRLALIDPVLTALGWSMANPLMVVVENTTQSFRADYVLYDSARAPKIVVEAKALGGNIPNGKPQLFATAGRIQANQQKTGFITDGLIWEHYDDKTALTNHAFRWSGNIASDDLQAIAAHLIQYLDAAQFWPQEEDTTAPEILQLQQDYSALEKRLAALESGKVLPPPPPTAKVWVELDDLPANMSDTKPSDLRLPDGTERQVKSWGQGLLMACEAVLNNNPTISPPIPDKAGASITLISDVQVPRSKRLTLANGKEVYVYLTYASDGSIANMKHILKQFPASKQSVKPAVVYGPA